MTDSSMQGRPEEVRRPAGDVYDWVSRGRDLLAHGHAGAAATLLRHAHDEEPGSRELTETLARAEFEAGRFAAARDMFASLVDLVPDSDYARFGLGVSLVRLGRHRDALPHLTMATVMRPGRAEYEQLLERARTVAGTDAPGRPPGPAEAAVADEGTAADGDTATGERATDGDTATDGDEAAADRTTGGDA